MNSRTLCRSMVAATLLLAVPGALSGQIAVRAETLHTMAGPAIENGVVVMVDGKITAVGPVTEVSIPADLEVLAAVVATPGLVDPRTVVGIAGQYNYDHDQDQLERSEPLQPELRAVDAYNARERLIDWVRSFGVTTLHTGHAPGELISGQTMIVKTRPGTVEAQVLVKRAMVSATLGKASMKQENKSPGTRAKQVAMLRQKLVEARDYLRRLDAGDESKRPARDLRLEVLGEVLKGEVPLLVTAHRSQDIMNALRLAEEFELKLVLDGAAEAHLLLEPIQDAGVPVILHPSMKRPTGDAQNLTFEAAARLRDAGIPFAIQSGYESYVPKTRVVLFEAAIAAANGLTFDEALAAITIDAARLLGIDDRVGSLEVGKDGDLALYDGDPFEYTTHCTATIIEGEQVSDVVR